MTNTAYPAYGQTSSNGSEHASSRASSPRQYQATVEDDPESFLENRSSCDSSGPYLFGDDNQGPHHQADSQIGPDRRPSVLRSASSHPSHLPHDKTTKNPRAPRIRHGNLHVHFSERQPPQTYSAKNIAPPEDTRPRQNSSRPRVSSSCQQGRFKSAVDLRWGLLFNENGYPTERLKQLLGGIAEHLVSGSSFTSSLLNSGTRRWRKNKNSI